MLKSEKKEIVKYGKLLVERGLVAGSWGNISVRVHDRIVITPSGSNYSTLSHKDLVVVDSWGNPFDGNKGTPSSELACHIAIYSAYPKVNAVIHTHSIYASAFAAAHKTIPPVIEDLAQIVGHGVQVAEYALPGGEQLADNCVAAMQDSSAVLLANHGVVTCGQCLQEAFIAAEIVEKSAKICILAGQLGGAQLLSDEDVDLMRNGYLNKYRKLQTGE